MEIDTDRHFIERMPWDEVARRIGDGAVAILPIGAAAKQHGFHLPSIPTAFRPNGSQAGWREKSTR
ncbi:hypothetical protein ACF1BQ_003710 [Bradyrhizobium sp. RDT10]